MIAAILQLHEGESLFRLSKWDVGFIVFFTIIFVLLVYWNKIPSVSAFRDFVEVLNTRGGNILILVWFSWMFYRSAMLFIFHVIALSETAGPMVDKAQAVVTAGLGFTTGSAFGGAFSALLKTMSPTVVIGKNGEENPPPKPVEPPTTPNLETTK